MSKLSIKYDKKYSSGFVLVTDNETNTNVLFESAPDNAFIGAKNDKLAFWIKSNEIKAYILNDGDKVRIVFSKDTTFPFVTAISLSNVSNLNLDNNSIVFEINNKKYEINTEDCTLALDANNNILVTLKNMHSTLYIENYNPKRLFSLLTISNRLYITYNQKIPEFSIQLYDDSEYTTLRPYRLGTQVVSTMPAAFESNPSKPKESRKIYFKINYDGSVPLTGSGYDISNNCNLYIALPDGFDLLQPPKIITMQAFNDNQSFAEYEFHRQDTINYVDGFCYMYVSAPFTVQRMLNMGFTVSASGNALTTDDFIYENVIVSSDSEMHAFSEQLTEEVKDTNLDE